MERGSPLVGSALKKKKKSKQEEDTFEKEANETKAKPELGFTARPTGDLKRKCELYL